MAGFRHPQLSSFNSGSLTNGSTDNDKEDMETGEESGHQNDVLQSDITQTALEMGLDRHLVERTLQEKMRRTGSEYSRIEDFIEDYFSQNPESNAAQTQDENLLELQRRKECKVNSCHQDILLSGNQAKMSGFRHPQLSSFNPGSLTNGSTDNDEEDMEIGEESGHQNDVQQSDITQTALEMGLDRHLVERTLQEKMRRTGSEYSRIEDFIEDYFNQNPESNAAQTQDETLLELQRRKECKVCMDRDTCIVFIPCGHLVTCQECAEALDKCPICYRDITRRQMSYWT